MEHFNRSSKEVKSDDNSENIGNEQTLNISKQVKLPACTIYFDSPSPSDLPKWPDCKVITRVTPVQPNGNTYKNLSYPRGNVYIFNNTFQNDPKNYRPGACCDSVNLKYIFERMGYTVFVNNDLSMDETYKKIDEIQKDKGLENVDSFIMVILSHGEDSTKFYASDMKQIHLDNIRYKFIDRYCPQLRGKAKIFLCNYCRGNIKQENLQTDAPYNYSGREAPTDMVTIHASIDGFRALRDASKGTVFVQSLCETLAKYAHNMELRPIYRFLSNMMKEKLGTTPELQEYVFKDFHFNPSTAITTGTPTTPFIIQDFPLLTSGDEDIDSELDSSLEGSSVDSAIEVETYKRPLKRVKRKRKSSTNLELAVLKLSAKLTEDQYTKFGLHTASQLRELPLSRSLVLQEKIQSLLTQERIASLSDL